MTPKAQTSAAASMATLSSLLLPLPRPSQPPVAPPEQILQISRADFNQLVTLAHSNHVVIRVLEAFQKRALNLGDAVRAEWAEPVLEGERSRIRHAVQFLSEICAGFQAEGLDITVMKSLDHWPDLGSDLDLFSSASPRAVVDLMQRRFGAKPSARSWGDRLAQKWNFELPGLPESVECHIGRLGQTGEQMVLASQLPSRARTMCLEGSSFPVPHASDRLMISTLQRMYRHFYFRLCDIVDSATLVIAGKVDFADLERSARAAGIWEGVATYLVIVSDYCKQYGDPGLDLPSNVLEAARFDGSAAYFAKEFVRVPIIPHASNLYRSQLAGLLREGRLKSSMRLGLLPWLATVAFVEHKRTGSDKGIW